MSSLNAKLNQAKLLDVGVEHYVWRNSQDDQDEGVVGNPSTSLRPVTYTRHSVHTRTYPVP